MKNSLVLSLVSTTVFGEVFLLELGYITLCLFIGAKPIVNNIGPLLP